MKTVMLMDQSNLLKILAEEYGIKCPRDLHKAVRMMEPPDLKPFCAPVKTKKEDKTS